MSLQIHRITALRLSCRHLLYAGEGAGVTRPPGVEASWPFPRTTGLLRGDSGRIPRESQWVHMAPGLWFWGIIRTIQADADLLHLVWQTATQYWMGIAV